MSRHWLYVIRSKYLQCQINKMDVDLWRSTSSLWLGSGFKTSNKANEWLVVGPPDALIEECPWGGDKFPKTCREIREMRRDGWQKGTDPNTDTLGLCQAAQREGTGLINERLWVVESLCPRSPLCHQRPQWLHQFAAIITSIGQKARIERKRSWGLCECWQGGFCYTICGQLNIHKWTSKSSSCNLLH